MAWIQFKSSSGYRCGLLWSAAGCVQLSRGFGWLRLDTGPSRRGMCLSCSSLISSCDASVGCCTRIGEADGAAVHYSQPVWHSSTIVPALCTALLKVRHLTLVRLHTVSLLLASWPSQNAPRAVGAQQHQSVQCPKLPVFFFVAILGFAHCLDTAQGGSAPCSVP